jgi:type IV pilus assembly protein PilA
MQPIIVVLAHQPIRLIQPVKKGRNMKCMQDKNGFTIIELLVTFGIIVILAVIGVPTYTKYRVRAKVATMVGSASAAEFAISNDYFNEGYTFANSTYSSGSQPFLVPNNNFVSSIAVTTGTITVTGNSSELGGRAINLTLVPTVTENNITWTCHSSSTFFDYVPDECRNP